jgi:hypothetical protein
VLFRSCVLDCGADLVYEGVAEFVFDTKADPVVVFETVVVLVEVDELVSVFDMADETDNPGLEEDDLELDPERVDVIVEVIVLVDVGEGVSSRVGNEDLVEVVVFVEVLEAVVERVGTAKFTLSLRSVEQLTKLFSSFRYGGVDPTAPIANNNKNHRITVST